MKDQSSSIVGRVGEGAGHKERMNINNNILQSPIRRRLIWPVALMVAAFTAFFGDGTVPVQATTYAVTLTMSNHLAQTISPYMLGISEETGSTTISNKDYNPNGYFWAATNAQLVQLFKNVNFTSIRIGGNTADGNTNGGLLPTFEDIDTFFGFAEACDLKVIYTLGLFASDFSASDDAYRANYIWSNYGSNMLDIAIGNEDEASFKYNNDFTTYINKWNSFASAITASNANVFLGGPDAENGGTTWVDDFASAEGGNNGVIDLATHYEPAGATFENSSYVLCQQALASSVDATDYPNMKSSFITANPGYNYSFTEFNSHYNGPASDGGDTNGNCNTFGNALFVLDALHWWAQNGLSTLHCHSGLGGFHCAFYFDGGGTLQAAPFLYGCKAFDIAGSGGRFGNGYVNPLTIANGSGVNLSAYSRKIGNNNYYITIINKEFGTGAKDASVTIIPPTGYTVGAKTIIYLVQAQHFITATNGVTLGGDSITGTNAWNGTWTTLGSLNNIVVTNMTAAIVRLQP
jgi:hypothetical protein